MNESRKEAAAERTAGTMNFRARCALTGYQPGGPSDVADILIELLRSEHEIDSSTRVELANALERAKGRYPTDEFNGAGHHIPRLAVEGLGRSGTIGKAILIRRNRLDAAEELVQKRKEGGKGSRLTIAVGARYGLDYDSMKKALSLRNRFNRELGTPGNTLAAEALNKFSLTPDDGEDFYYCARALFIEREATAGRTDE